MCIYRDEKDTYEIRDEVTVAITLHGPGDFIILYHGQEELNKLWRVRRCNGFQNLVASKVINKSSPWYNLH